MSEKHCTWKAKINPIHQQNRNTFPFISHHNEICADGSLSFVNVSTHGEQDKEGIAKLLSSGCSQGTWCSHKTINEVETKCSGGKKRLEWHLSSGNEWKNEFWRFFILFYLFYSLPPSLPKMNWLFRFKKVHGWNTKRGSSISPE